MQPQAGTPRVPISGESFWLQDASGRVSVERPQCGPPQPAGETPLSRWRGPRNADGIDVSLRRKPKGLKAENCSLAKSGEGLGI